MYSRIDAREDGRVHGVCSGFSQPAADVTFLDPINAEHTVPQSWFGSAEPMRSDIHHLFPTHKDVNAARSAKPFGEVTDSQTDRWYATTPAGELLVETRIPTASPERFAEDDRDEFEPLGAQKGDTARAIFYFATMYPGRGRAIERIVADGLPALLAWHAADPPDARERQRNARVEAEQGNRNPYVDHPAVACGAWDLPC
jgi:endonuclease I